MSCEFRLLQRAVNIASNETTSISQTTSLPLTTFDRIRIWPKRNDTVVLKKERTPTDIPRNHYTKWKWKIKLKKRQKEQIRRGMKTHCVGHENRNNVCVFSCNSLKCSSRSLSLIPTYKQIYESITINKFKQPCHNRTNRSSIIHCKVQFNVQLHANKDEQP